MATAATAGTSEKPAMTLTPMMQQYQEIKASHPDALLMFRLGDFYELFYDDAVTASQVLDITLTGRDAGQAGRAPMCGVPFHSVEQYIERLTDKGFRVAICDQTEDPKQAKGLVQRKVTRVVTPGTAVRNDQPGNRFLCGLVVRESVWAIAAVDIGTGEAFYGQSNHADKIKEWLELWQPVEVLTYDGLRDEESWGWFDIWVASRSLLHTVRMTPRHIDTWASETLCKQYRVASLASFGLDQAGPAAEALALTVSYVQDTQMRVLSHLRPPESIVREPYLVVDTPALRNLEVLETVRTRQRKGSLLGLLDRAVTPMGSRLIRRWLERPSISIRSIEDRLDAVHQFVEEPLCREELREAFGAVYDLDRLMSRVAFGTANGRDLVALSRSLAAIPTVKLIVGPLNSTLLHDLLDAIESFDDLVDTLSHTLVDNPPLTIREGGIIQPGVDPELDELRSLNANGKAWLAALEQRERDRTGIKSLKVGYNKVFGYFIEVSKSNQHLVPDDYERRQTLSTAERYVIRELKEREAQILNAEERACEREYQLFVDLRESVLSRMEAIQTASSSIAAIDALASFATVSVSHGYVRPRMQVERGIRIERGRHPTVEAVHPGRFVANDVTLDEDQPFILITGPNMAGKSTYMRQTALIVILAHVGCFVPGEEAVIGIVDRIFTRIGASDDLGAGQSTFMVEMVELAQILRLATNRSLVLLDEIGRGTSTYDGLCIAESVMEALRSESRQPLTLFATHYHELTETAQNLSGVVNYSVAVHESDDDITFLHTVVKRPADKSYGIQVARLAGIPSDVIHRATELLQTREARLETDAQIAAARSNDPPATGRTPRKPWTGGSPVMQLPLFNIPLDELVAELARIDVLQMTPLEAIQSLGDLVRRAREVQSWDKSV